MRPQRRLAAASGVGEHTARESESAQQCATEGARGERPPQFGPEDLFLGAILIYGASPRDLSPTVRALNATTLPAIRAAFRRGIKPLLQGQPFGGGDYDVDASCNWNGCSGRVPAPRRR